MIASNLVLVRTETDSPRFRYTLDIVLGRLLGLQWKIVPAGNDNDLEMDATINYSATPSSGHINLFPSGLLSEKGVHDLQPDVFIWDGVPVFFRVPDGGDLPFDPFSMAFFLVTRYEEYRPHLQDKHGRFAVENSLAYRHDFLHFPVVHVIAARLGELLRKRFPFLETNMPAYSFTPTVDVDIAYAHLGKDLVRATGGFAKLVLTGRYDQLKQRMAVIAGKQDDPYDNFRFQVDSFREFGLEAIYFILIGDYGPYDKNISYRNKRFRSLIRWLSENTEVGIHPSYRSFDEPVRLEEEINRLRDITGKEILHSRRHFLRMKFPDSLKQLISCGITHDHSMGFASVNGFRAGICVPYPFYDLNMDQTKNLLIHSFAFMDTAMQDYLKIKPQEYLIFVKSLQESVMKYGGNLSGIWHNYAMADDHLKHQSFLDILKMVSHDKVSSSK
ncbi:MAG: polysaccharide deacetylase family protein [Bacteroidetes bacterium]|nr:polysaccharide deacetylase family protein [Bacteroidota bacterium]